MRRELSVLVLSLAACASSAAPSSVETGLDGVRSLASLDEAEMERACDGWLAYAEATIASPDGPSGVTCAISAALEAESTDECEAAYAACIATAPALATFCAEGARIVPDCDVSVTVDHYESCMTLNIERMAELDVDCSLAGRDDEIRARLATWAVSAECAPLQQRECAPFAPASP